MEQSYRFSSENIVTADPKHPEAAMDFQQLSVSVLEFVFMQAVKL